MGCQLDLVVLFDLVVLYRLVTSPTKIGYEINFTKYFYEFKPLRQLANIKADILALEEKTLETQKTVLES